MKVIIPIGGGSIDNKSTLKIDEFIVNLVKKGTKKVLLIPSAGGDNDNYIEKFKEYYTSFGCEVDALCLTKITNDNLIRSKIFSSDIIYIGGGNTGKLMRILKRTKVNEYLRLAYERGIILTGISAGAMVYFESGYSDCNRSTDPNTKLTYLKCLNMIPYCFCPHYNEQERKEFDCFVKEKQINGIAIEDDCALLFIDDKINGVIKCNSNNNGYYLTSTSKEEINDVTAR